jgi:hypothetical protein
VIGNSRRNSATSCALAPQSAEQRGGMGASIGGGTRRRQPLHRLPQAPRHHRQRAIVRRLA